MECSERKISTLFTPQTTLHSFCDRKKHGLQCTHAALLWRQCASRHFLLLKYYIVNEYNVYIFFILLLVFHFIQQKSPSSSVFQCAMFLGRARKVPFRRIFFMELTLKILLKVGTYFLRSSISCIYFHKSSFKEKMNFLKQAKYFIKTGSFQYTNGYIYWNGKSQVTGTR